MSVRTVKITNLSLSASEQDVKEFFSFSGEIEHVEMHSADTYSQIAYVTFKDAQGADTAVLLSGATIVDMSVVITPAPEYTPPPSAPPYVGPGSNPQAGASATSAAAPPSPVEKAEDVVSSMLARGFTLGKDAVSKARSFDQRHGLTSTASAKVTSLDRKIGLSDKFVAGTGMVSGKVKEVDHRFQVSEKTKSALSAAEQKVSSAGSTLMKNRYVFSSMSWVTGAFSKAAQAASDVGAKTKEKMAAQEKTGGPGSGAGAQ